MRLATAHRWTCPQEAKTDSPSLSSPSNSYILKPLPVILPSQVSIFYSFLLEPRSNCMLEFITRNL